MTDCGFIFSLLVIYCNILYIRGCGVPQDKCRNQEYVQLIPDKALIGYVIANNTVATLHLCRIQCYIEPRCVSFNFGQSSANSANCQLSSSEAETHPRDLIDRPGTIYQGTKNKCGNVTCPPPMDCHSGYEPQGYHCRYPDKCCKSPKQVPNERVLYFPRKSTRDYIKVITSFSSNLTAFTISLMAKFQSIQVGHENTPFTLSSPNKINNLCIFIDRNAFYLYVSDRHIKFQVGLNDGKWHHICATWESTSGSWQVYIDGRIHRRGTDLAAGKVIGNGIAIIGQDQDHIMGGGFVQKQSFFGNLTSMSLWDRVLTPHDGSFSFLTNFECHPKQGQVLGWVDMLKGEWHGNIIIQE